MIQELLADADPIVLNRKYKASHPRNSRHHLLGSDSNCASVGSIFDGIVDEIDQDLADLAGISQEIVMDDIICQEMQGLSLFHRFIIDDAADLVEQAF